MKSSVVEAVNVGHAQIFNERALEYARNNHLPVMAGSDQHNTEIRGGGMAFPRRIEDIHELCQALLRGEAVELLCGIQQTEKYK